MEKKLFILVLCVGSILQAGNTPSSQRLEDESFTTMTSTGQQTFRAGRHSGPERAQYGTNSNPQEFWKNKDDSMKTSTKVALGATASVAVVGALYLATKK